MSKSKDDVILSFLMGFLFGIALFSSLKRRRKHKGNLDRVKDNLDKGFLLDNENLSNDWQHIYYDLDRSSKKLKEDLYETV